jgi:protoheme IX farnesyltransferase
MLLTELTTRARAYWTLTKSLQTGLLLVTGVAGYASARCPVMTWQTVLALLVSLFLAIGGSTVLNMVYDRDIDALMTRTCHRPLPTGTTTVREALVLGLLMAAVGVGWALSMSTLYGLVVFAGVFFDMAIYTAWLKRRTAFSIIIGGLAGGMPILAGRVLGAGRLDGIGLLLALAVLLWIPTHIMTFSIRYANDYARAHIPTFPSTYGVKATRFLISASSIGAAVAVMAAAVLIGMSWGYLRFLALLGVGLLGLAIANVVRPSARINFSLFKYASLYMLSTMLLVVAGAV